MRLAPEGPGGAWVVAEAAVAYGGVAAKAVMAKEVRWLPSTKALKSTCVSHAEAWSEQPHTHWWAH